MNLPRSCAPVTRSIRCGVLGFLIVAGAAPCFAEDLTLIQVLGAQASTALYVARIRKSEAAHVSELHTLTRELRGSLLGPMVAHGVNNGLTLLLLLLVAG